MPDRACQVADGNGPLFSDDTDLRNTPHLISVVERDADGALYLVIQESEIVTETFVRLGRCAQTAYPISPRCARTVCCRGNR